MNSHEYAEKMKEVANTLLGRPAFDTGREQITEVFWFWDKDEFLAAAKAIGAGRKEVSGTEFHFYMTSPENSKVGITIARDKVCTKIQEEVWECQPMLTQKEVDAVGADVLALEPQIF
jgi:hypothetical protein